MMKPCIQPLTIVALTFIALMRKRKRKTRDGIQPEDDPMNRDRLLELLPFRVLCFYMVGKNTKKSPASWRVRSCAMPTDGGRCTAEPRSSRTIRIGATCEGSCHAPPPSLSLDVPRGPVRC